MSNKQVSAQNTTDTHIKSQIDDMKRRLQIHGNGAHAHTANKAQYYLNTFPEQLLPLCEAALSSDNWKPLELKMRNLW